ncbi:hypothetical protein D3C78_1303430 [compost metagenome]
MIVNEHIACARFHHAGKHFRQCRFTGTVLADNRQRLLFAQGKAERFYRLDCLAMKQASAIAKGLTEIAYFKQCFDHFTLSPCSAGNDRQKDAF